MTNLPQHEGLAGLALFLIAVSFVLPAVKSTHGEMSAIDLVVNGTASTYKGKEKGSHAQRIESLDFRLTGGAANFLAALAFYAFFQRKYSISTWLAGYAILLATHSTWSLQAMNRMNSTFDLRVGNSLWLVSMVGLLCVACLNRQYCLKRVFIDFEDDRPLPR